ncbi:MAG TPA: GNAT family protein [Bryobacteraceae bacterium]|nr:GNAT family protein [Bryobacteraceae bacterium]
MPLAAIEPVTLAGAHVRLEPLGIQHLPGLCEVGLDPELWRWIPIFVATTEDMRAYVESAVRDQIAGLSLPFATIDAATNRPIGSTRFMNIDRGNRHVEIGSTWLAQPWQRTAANTEAKYLMLRHAFETLGCMRVELKTDALNERSRAAITRIGAKFEGIFRRHVVCYGGRIRDTAWFSIIDAEWPEVKARLEQKLERSTAAL